MSLLCRVLRVSSLTRGEISSTLLVGVYLVRPALDTDAALGRPSSLDDAGVHVELRTELRLLLLSGEVSGRDE